MTTTADGRPDTRSTTRSATEDAIVRAAESEFGRHGYASTTIGGIAQAAAVSRPLVYRYFGDKPTLYREVVARLLTEWNDALVAVADQAAPTTAHTIGSITTTCLDWAAEHVMLRGVLLRDHDITRRVARTQIDEGRGLLPTLLERVLAAGIDRGDIRSDIDPATMAWVLTETIAAGSLVSMSTDADADLRSARTNAMIEIMVHGVVITRSGP